jgi:glycosyltransferase involved in cell wall biosynthesis
MRVASHGAVLHVMGWRSQQYGSFERFLVALADACGRAGLSTHLVFNAPVASEAFLRDVNADVHAIPSPASPVDPRFPIRFARLVRRVRPSHLHVHFGPDSYQALAVAALARVPRRFATKRIVPARSRSSSLRHRWLAAQVERFFTVSESVRDDLVALGVPASKVEACYHGIDSDAYRPNPEAGRRTREALGIAADARVVLTTSHLRPGKGVEALPPLAAALSERPGGVVVLAAGAGPLANELRQEAARLGVPDGALRLLGVREDVPELLAASDLHLFPTTGTEGFASAPLEALSAGVPVVATAVSDVPRLLSEVAIVVAPGDLEGMVSACREVLDGVHGDLGARGRALVVEHLSVRRAAELHLEAYLRGR